VVDPSLSIKGLRAGYGSLDILNGVDLDVPQGQFVALMGPNGAGKSTLLKSLYGMTKIKDGSIEWRGKNIAGYKSRAILAEGIAFVRRAAAIFRS
jgi:ABC-type branched-chain amino acid transport systems, ATPase component